MIYVPKILSPHSDFDCSYIFKVVYVRAAGDEENMTRKKKKKRKRDSEDTTEESSEELKIKKKRKRGNLMCFGQYCISSFVVNS